MKVDLPQVKTGGCLVAVFFNKIFMSGCFS